MFRSLLLVAAFVLISGTTVSAATFPSGTPEDQPALVSFGINYINFDKTQARRQGMDFRGEYRWGLSMLPLVSNYFKSWDPYVQFHPWAGVEATSLAQAYGAGGWAMDWYISKHYVFTWQEGVGLFDSGNAVRMGSVIEFRSQGEVGYRFDNNVRFSFEVSHISNAKITKFNPGSEIAGFYLHIPFENMVGKKQ